ncbi:glycerophosphodiester phosphodiesterase [uncultured Sphaerochaeta sp.]|uniref:glycerophosphodiester phosphodiesterase n=1 Tax=uncultured Sphaerochaeta sp. TaxID=886478 RepID=UPI002A0A8537|nr:glycerophosphodiester phosphodiesterase [uncultured Sphaerochaeta sp.]
MNTNLLITVHSGGLSALPNSYEYLQQACLLAPDIIEVDVRKTLDDRIVLWHDAILPGCFEPISQMPYKQLLEKYPKLLVLETALDLCGEHAISTNLDIKEFAAIPEVCRILQKEDCLDRVVFSGCGKAEIELIYSLLPSARVLFNVQSWDREVFPQYKDYVLSMVQQAQDLKAFGLNVCYKDVKKEFLQYAHKHMLPVFVWTVDTRELMREMILMGVYSLTTHNVELLRNEIAYLNDCMKVT